MSVYPGPTPPFTNPTIDPTNFQPSRFEISAISLGATTTVTTSTAHNYVVGQLVRFLIPYTYGTYQLNNQTGYVLSLPSTTQIEVDVNTSLNYNAFDANPSFGPTPPEVLAVGDINSGIISSTGSTISTTNIPGAFRNIS